MAKPKKTKIPRIVQLPSGAYYCRVRVNGEDISITDMDYNIVEAKAYAYKAGLIEEKKRPRDINVGEAIDEYIKHRENVLAPSTIRGYRQIRNTRFQRLMLVPLSRVTRSLLQQHINAEAKTYSAKTIKNSFALIQSALYNKDIDIDWKRLLFPQQRKPESKTLTRDELAKLLKQVKGTDLELMVVLSAWLSLRRSEMLGLEKSDFNINIHILNIRRALIPEGNPEQKTTPTKTYKSQRTIITDPYISALVAKYPEGRLFNDYALYYLRQLWKACDDAGVPRTTFQALRHFNASAMAVVGIDTKYAMQRGGWASEHTMRNVYQEIMDDGAVNAADKVNSYFHSMLEG